MFEFFTFLDVSYKSFSFNFDDDKLSKPSHDA